MILKHNNIVQGKKEWEMGSDSVHKGAKTLSKVNAQSLD